MEMESAVRASVAQSVQGQSIQQTQPLSVIPQGSMQGSGHFPIQKDTTFTKLFVGGLPYHTTSESLRKHFEHCGDIEEAVVITDKLTDKSKGYGFVTMSDKLGAEKAIENPNPTIDGRKANVNLAYLGAKPRTNNVLSEFGAQDDYTNELRRSNLQNYIAMRSGLWPLGYVPNHQGQSVSYAGYPYSGVPMNLLQLQLQQQYGAFPQASPLSPTGQTSTASPHSHLFDYSAYATQLAGQQEGLQAFYAPHHHQHTHAHAGASLQHAHLQQQAQVAAAQQQPAIYSYMPQTNAVHSAYQAQQIATPDQI